MADIARPVPRAINSFDGTIIGYDFYEVGGDAVVVILPGFWRTRRHDSLTTLARMITLTGRSVAILDLRGHGESGGRFGFNREEYRDVELVLADLERHRGRLRFMMVGLSLGGAVAVTLAARTDRDIRGLMLISPVADFGKIRPRLNPFELPRHLAFGQAFRRPRFDWGFLRSPKFVAAADMQNVSCATCLVHVVNDWLIHHEHSCQLSDSHTGECELHLIELPFGYHADRIFSAAPGQVEDILERFLDKHLPVQESY